MEQKNFFRVTVESANVQPGNSYNYSNKMTYESEFSDEDIDTIIDGFIACMRGVGFMESTILSGMMNAIEAHNSALPEERIVSDNEAHLEAVVSDIRNVNIK